MIIDQMSCFKLKASFFPCTILQLLRYDLNEFEQQLMKEISRAPQFFLGSPVIIDLEKVKNLGILNFSELKQIIIKAGLVPVGVRGGDEEQLTVAEVQGLPRVSLGRTQTADKKKENVADTSCLTRLITTPVRSGMHIYAKQGDLIITSPVSSGAELLADGHIHVYGPLRGRALAGVTGNTEARIFCRTLEAELVSIAGYYLTKDDILNLPDHSGMIQIYLVNEQVKIETI